MGQELAVTAQAPRSSFNGATQWFGVLFREHQSSDASDKLHPCGSSHEYLIGQRVSTQPTSQLPGRSELGILFSSIKELDSLCELTKTRLKATAPTPLVTCEPVRVCQVPAQ